MKALLKYIEKNNYNYKVVRYGSDYFDNVTPVIVDALQIEIDAHAAADIAKIYKYCKRYNYIVAYDRFIYPNRYITIFNKTDYNAYNLYFDFRDPCIEECNQLAHRFYTEPLAINLNAELINIMLSWGEKLNAARAIDAA